MLLKLRSPYQSVFQNFFIFYLPRTFRLLSLCYDLRIHAKQIHLSLLHWWLPKNLQPCLWMFGTFVVGLQCCILKWMSFSDGLKMELGLTFSFLTPLLATVYRGSTHEMAQTMNGLKMAMNDSFVTKPSRLIRFGLCC